MESFKGMMAVLNAYNKLYEDAFYHWCLFKKNVEKTMRSTKYSAYSEDIQQSDNKVFNLTIFDNTFRVFFVFGPDVNIAQHDRRLDTQAFSEWKSVGEIKFNHNGIVSGKKYLIESQPAMVDHLRILMSSMSIDWTAASIK